MSKLPLEEREPMDKLTKLVGRLLAVMGVSYVVFTTWNRLSLSHYHLQDINIRSQAITLAFVLAMFCMSFAPHSDIYVRVHRKFLRFPIQALYRWLQVLVLVINASIAILRNPESAYGFPLMMIAGVLSLKYGTIRVYGFAGLFIYYIVLQIISLVFNGMYIQGIRYLVFSLSCLLIAALLYKDELKRKFEYIDQVRRDEQEKQQKLKQALNRYEMETLDPSTIGLTPRELEVLQILCLYRSTNHELAARLGLRVQTVKTHMQRIFDKAGVDDRYQLIDLCRPFFFDDQGTPVIGQGDD